MVEPFLDSVVTIMVTVVGGYNKESEITKLLSQVFINTLLVD